MSKEFEIDYGKAIDLYVADPKLWEDYYAGKRVSGFHPSWERTYGETRPPALNPEQRDFLKELQEKKVPDKKRTGDLKPQAGANPFDLETQDLKLQAKLLEHTPALAEQLINKAGRNPKLFGL